MATRNPPSAEFWLPGTAAVTLSAGKNAAPWNVEANGYSSQVNGLKFLVPQAARRFAAATEELVARVSGGPCPNQLLEPAPGDRPTCRVLALPEIHVSSRRFWFEILTGTRRQFTYLA